MFTLTQEFDDRFEYEGMALHVDMSYDNILRLFEMFDDELFYEFEKIPLALEILVEEYEELSKKTYDEQLTLFKYIMKEFLEIDMDAEHGTPKKIMDYKKDASLIYASFFAVYKLDLVEMRGKLHWEKFQALLTHLHDESPLKQVISYRTMKVPDSSKTSEEYRNHVLKMKRIYALDGDEKENINHAFDMLESALKAGAEVKRNE